MNLVLVEAEKNTNSVVAKINNKKRALLKKALFFNKIFQHANFFTKLNLKSNECKHASSMGFHVLFCLKPCKHGSLA